jgi:hypothetical protein
MLLKRLRSLDCWRAFLPDVQQNVTELPAPKSTSEVPFPPHVTPELLRRIQSVCICLEGLN